MIHSGVRIAAVMVAGLIGGGFWQARPEAHAQTRPPVPSAAPAAAARSLAIADCISAPEPALARPPRKIVVSEGPTAFRPECDDAGCGAWRTFRQKHPFPYQAFAGGRLDGGRAVLVLAEPPPDISRAQATELLGDLFADRHVRTSVRRWMIGSDGYVQDVVAVFDAPGLKSDDLLSDPDIRDRLAMLHLAWYGTACGGDVEAISSDTALTPAPAPNLRISAAELKAWLGDPAVSWLPIETRAAPATWAQVAARRGVGAYVTADRSLVMLTFPRAVLNDPRQLQRIRSDFRRFAVSSDAIVGGVWTPAGQVALVGRARTRSLSSVPPLRFETFALIAAQGADELAQSYERTNPLAGRIVEEKRDWAPIYLSTPLIDTEFGALLNVTDQMLKGWSEAGTVNYLYWDYPLRPAKYPFALPLSQLVYETSGGTSVLFNWNTSGSAVTLGGADMTVLVGRQLGSLPVTYGSDAKVAGKMETGNLLAFEDTAYKYFSDLGDPNLARVVQYTLIYQTFRNMDQARQAPEPGVTSLRPETQVLADRLEALLLAVSSLDASRLPAEEAAEMNAIKAKVADFRRRHPEFTGAQIAMMLADRQAGPDILRAQGHPALAGEAGLRATEARLNRDIDAFNAKVRARAPIAPTERDSLSARQSELNQAIALYATRQRTLMGDLELLSHTVGDVGQALNLSAIRIAYEKASARPNPGWIRTPSNVVSWGDKGVGGHNIDAKALKLEASAAVQGVQVTKDGRVLYNPSLAGRVADHAGEIARAAEHGRATPEQLNAILAVDVPKRPRWQALARSGPEPTPAIGGGKLGGRTFTEPGEFAEAVRAVKAQTPCCRVMARDGTGRLLLAEASPSPPPTVQLTAFNDSTSLGMHLQRGRGRLIDLIVLDQPQGSIEALLTTIRVADEPVGFLATVRRGAKRMGLGRGDHVIAEDLDGRVGSLTTPTAPGTREARANQLSAFRGQKVRGGSISVIEPSRMRELTASLGWDAARDGAPTALHVSFSGGQPGFNGFDVVAGFTKGTAQQNAQKLQAIVQTSTNPAKGEVPLTAVQLSIKNSLRNLSDEDVGKIAFVLKQGSGEMQLTLLLPSRRGGVGRG